MDGGRDDSQAVLYQVLVDRCQRLEANHERLEKQFKTLLQERSSGADMTDNDRRRSSTTEMTSDSGGKSSDSSWAFVAGAYFSVSPYKNMLDCMGHAVYVTRPGSGEIIYWNRAAEKLFEYEGYELIGKKITALHIDEERILWAEKIMESLRRGRSWSGQFPFKKKSGQIFMAIVTQSPLYEDGELVGIITVSIDAAVINNQNVKTAMECHGQDAGQSRIRGLNLKKIRWGARPQTASSVSDLASKVMRKREDRRCNECCNGKDKEENELENTEMKSERPPRAPARRQRFQYSKSFTEKRKVEGNDSLNMEPTREFLQPS